MFVDCFRCKSLAGGWYDRHCRWNFNVCSHNPIKVLQQQGSSSCNHDTTQHYTTRRDKTRQPQYTHCSWQLSHCIASHHLNLYGKFNRIINLHSILLAYGFVCASFCRMCVYFGTNHIQLWHYIRQQSKNKQKKTQRKRKKADINIVYNQMIKSTGLTCARRQSKCNKNPKKYPK